MGDRRSPTHRRRREGTGTGLSRFPDRVDDVTGFTESNPDPSPVDPHFLCTLLRLVPVGRDGRTGEWDVEGFGESSRSLETGVRTGRTPPKGEKGREQETGDHGGGGTDLGGSEGRGNGLRERTGVRRVDSDGDSTVRRVDVVST